MKKIRITKVGHFVIEQCPKTRDFYIYDIIKQKHVDIIFEKFKDAMSTCMAYQTLFCKDSKCPVLIGGKENGSN